MTTTLESPAVMLLLACLALLYLLPTLIAFIRGSPRMLLVAFVNIFGGWTIGGWFLSFAMAVW